MIYWTQCKMQTWGSLFKVHEEFQGGGNSAEPRVRPFLAQGQWACPAPLPTKMVLTGRWCVATPALWLPGAHLRVKHTPRAAVTVTAVVFLLLPPNGLSSALSPWLLPPGSRGVYASVSCCISHSNPLSEKARGISRFMNSYPVGNTQLGAIFMRGCFTDL